MLTDSTIPNNKPDSTMHDNVTETCVLVDVAESGERNVIKKETQILNIKTEIQHMWNVTTTMIPVTIGSTETL